MPCQCRTCFVWLPLACFFLLPIRPQNLPPAGFGVIRGTVIDGSGHPLAHARVAADRLEGPGGREYVGFTDDDGRFKIGPLPTGTYTVHAGKEEAGYPDNFFAFFASPLRPAPNVAVRSRETIKGIVVQLVTIGAWLKGELLDARTGHVVASASAKLCRDDTKPPACVGMGVGRVEGEGKFSILVPSRTPLSIAITAPGYESRLYTMQGTAELQPHATKNLVVRLIPSK